MRHKTYDIRAEWDEHAAVWIATSGDVPGLCCEAQTFEELLDIVVDLVPELLVENGVLTSAEAAEVPLTVTAERRAIARRAA
jgi:hypothetical protein